ncbi:cysteine desulfurase/selenocysteine lyase [Duganella sp. SG902]|uniref:family 2A encapsulin nanocompartment cargo protein cysteine desulfurase n=1 Tax=Duganella sp. SG902 TaxID=2587016 RepID=UPI00159E67BA|nr:family 2A encapsulin nanocompartment cargo protein cysteine desulfurase [Duganella sp. SG902]NVM79051.1 cysteine desulfurase/selenocysteine lyase [Duganella sp. SG902]
MSQPSPTLPDGAPFDTAALARLANELFKAGPGGPGASLAPPAGVPGVQAPANVAPAGSPLASPAGLGPSVPGTPIPQGQLPGTNLIPASPTQLPSLANRVPALAPSAQAGNGVPDKVYSSAPAYEPRGGSNVLGVPALNLGGQRQADAPAYYFLNEWDRPAAAPAPSPALGAFSSHPPFDVHAVRRDFPILRERVNGRQLVWFDNAATTHKPQSVIDRISYFYEHENSNIHRAAHELAARATDAYEGARQRVQRFINAPDVNEVIFVRGTTEAINLVAKSWGAQHIGEGDEIIVSHLEHHANIVPWQQLAAAKGARLRVIPVDDSGQILLDEYRKLLNHRTKLVSITQVSNALGTVTPVREVVALAHSVGAKALVDGAQSVSHMRIDVQALGADFFVFSGHKVFGPTGIGALWGKREVLEDMPPWQGGGNMIADVTFEKTVYQPIPNKFEAGTGNIADAVGLGAAIDYVNRIGIDNIARYEHELLEYGTHLLRQIPGVRLIGTAADKASVMSFVLDGYTTEEVGKALNEEGIAVRTGHHCAQPILRRFGVETTVRPSLAFYNTYEEIDRLIAVVRQLAR